MNQHASPAPPPRSRPELQVKPVGDDLVVYDPRARQVHLLNGTAAAIFRMCDGRSSAAAIAEELARRYEAPPSAELERDVHRTLEALREKDLLL
jgi:PqqD family protein of HPr-rel-A system